MQVGEQRVVWSQTSDLDVLRLLDLDDHLRVREKPALRASACRGDRREEQYA